MDGIPFHPYYTVHDFQATVAFLFIFCAVVFFMPEMFGYFLEKPNFEQRTRSNAGPDRAGVVFHALLFDAAGIDLPVVRLGGEVLGIRRHVAAILLPAVLPWLDRSPVKSIRYKGIGFQSDVGAAGGELLRARLPRHVHTTPLTTGIAQVCTMIYFAYFC